MQRPDGSPRHLGNPGPTLPVIRLGTIDKASLRELFPNAKAPAQTLPFGPNPVNRSPLLVIAGTPGLILEELQPLGIGGTPLRLLH